MCVPSYTLCACVITQLLQRSRHVLEARRRGVVAVPHHAPETDQTGERLGTAGKAKKGGGWGEGDQSDSEVPQTRAHTHAVSQQSHSADTSPTKLTKHFRRECITAAPQTIYLVILQVISQSAIHLVIHLSSSLPDSLCPRNSFTEPNPASLPPRPSFDVCLKATSPMAPQLLLSLALSSLTWFTLKCRCSACHP